MDYGKTFAQLRKSKQFTLKEAAQETISTAQLSRFENGKTMLTVHQFFQCLKNINVSIEEFQFIQKSSFRNRYEKIFSRLSSALNEQKVVEIIELREELQNKSKSPYDINQFLVYFIDNVVDLWSNEEKKHLVKQKSQSDGQYKEQVFHYLQQVEEWGEMELRIYSMLFISFDVDTNYYFIKKALKKANVYRKVSIDQHIYFNLLNNLFSYFIYKKHLPYAKEMLMITEEALKKDVNLLTPQMLFLFNKGIYEYKTKNLEKGQLYFDQTISIAKIFQQKDMEKQFKNRAKLWKENHEKEDFHEITLMINFGGS